jgi:tRNA threonylcarbamoyladenosine biosynthesis protein TsaE
MPLKSVTITANRMEATRALGIELGRRAQPGTTITLTGDLGSGKTTLVQGLAQGLQVPAEYYVTSPSYTLINAYPGRCRLFHVDLYRLGDALEIETTGLTDILDTDGVVAIEWAERLPDGWLRSYLHIHLEVSADETRRIVLNAYGQAYRILIKQIEKFSKELE